MPAGEGDVKKGERWYLVRGGVWGATWGGFCCKFQAEIRYWKRSRMSRLFPKSNIVVTIFGLTEIL